jgi:hypothetical protein
MEAFNMSFLDVMSCGFGAVILFFMIINAQVHQPDNNQPEDLSGETTRLEYEILNQRKNLVLAKNSIEDLKDEKVSAEQQIAAIIALIEKLKKEMKEFDSDSLAKVKRVEKLQSDIESLEKERNRLLALEQASKEEGAKVRRFTGDGDRQYLTGLKVGGEHILVLVDASASMLDRKIINVIRRRNMSDAIKLRSLKWRQAVATVDWLSAQFPEKSKFQIYTFNTEPKPILKGSDGIWLEVGDGKQLDEAIRLLRRTIPENGTNMLGAYSVIKDMNPLPDNVILLIDGLPTMNAPETARGMITGRERFKLFLEAEQELPRGVPVNVLLFPMEGDYEATISFWVHAWSTGGSFMSISKDWP